MFKLDTFTLDFTGVELGIPVWGTSPEPPCLFTLWVFVALKAPSIVSARAKNKRDSQAAPSLAVSQRWEYISLVTLLSLSVLARRNWRGMRNPSITGLMVKMMGPWESIIAAGLIIVCLRGLSKLDIMAAGCRFWRQPINPSGHLRATKCARRAFCIVMAPVISVCKSV